MADDLDLSSKKKKKKGPIDVADEVHQLKLEETQKEEKSIKHAVVAAAEDSSDQIDFGKKKKKKKGDTMADTEKIENDELSGEAADALADAIDVDFSQLKKKKTKKTKLPELEEGQPVPVQEVDTSGEPDYSYDELLQRVYVIIAEKNPEMVSGEKKKFMMKPPQVMRAGTKKTAFANFAEICRLMKRQPKHVLQFLLAELGTSGSVDGNNQLIIKGRFQQKHIESVLRKYIKEYVTCHTCKSPETNLQKDTRLFFLECETCHSRCSVASIKTGFQAVTTKRAHTRAQAGQ